MKLLSTKFTLDKSVTRDGFMKMALSELSRNQGSTLDLNGFSWLDGTGPFMIKSLSGDESVTVYNLEQALILEVSRNITEKLTATDTFVLRDKDAEPSMYVSMEQETESLGTALEPDIEVPAIVRGIFWQEWGGLDMWLNTDGEVHGIRRGKAQKAAGLFAPGGMDAFCNPVVYLSVDENGRTPFDADTMAEALAGQAHVLLESSPVVHDDIAALVPKDVTFPIEFPCGGQAAVLFPVEGVYLFKPDGGLLSDIIQMIRHRMLQVSPGEKYDPVKLKNQNLLASLTDVLEDRSLADAFESVLQDREHRIEELDAENVELRTEIARLVAKNESLRNGLDKAGMQEGGKFITLQVTRNELYDGELKDVVLKALSQVKSGMDENLTRVRKYHVLTDVLEHNFPCQTDARLIECVRGAVKDGTLDRQGIGCLRSAGFLVEDASSNHIKVSLGEGRDKYTCVFSGTPSDRLRGAKNFVSELSCQMFGS